MGTTDRAFSPAMPIDHTYPGILPEQNPNRVLNNL